jgi:hypothetical protein
MHWFWRAAIAVGVGFALGSWMVRADGPNHLLMPLWIHYVQPLKPSGFPTAGLLIYLPGLLVVVGVYGVCTRYWSPRSRFPNETYCRRCGYILRGISEPRCPECGERI